MPRLFEFHGAREHGQARVWTTKGGVDPRPLENRGVDSCRSFDWGVNAPETRGPLALSASLCEAVRGIRIAKRTVLYVRDDLLRGLGKEWTLSTSAILDSIARGSEMAGSFSPNEGNR